MVVVRTTLVDTKRATIMPFCFPRRKQGPRTTIVSFRFQLSIPGQSITIVIENVIDPAILHDSHVFVTILPQELLQHSSIVNFKLHPDFRAFQGKNSTERSRVEHSERAIYRSLWRVKID